MWGIFYHMFMLPPCRQSIDCDYSVFSSGFRDYVVFYVGREGFKEL